MDEICHWKYDESEYFYETECGHLHIFIDGTPKDNEYVYCPYCGKKLSDIELFLKLPKPHQPKQGGD